MAPGRNNGGPAAALAGYPTNRYGAGFNRMPGPAGVFNIGTSVEYFIFLTLSPLLEVYEVVSQNVTTTGCCLDYVDTIAVPEAGRMQQPSYPK